MAKIVSMEDVISLIEDKLNSEGLVTFTPSGSSMYPTIVSGVDTITIEKVNKPIKKYDIIMYRRDSGTYVVHRVVGVQDNSYVLRGDNQSVKEYGIKKNQVIGIVSEYVHKEKIVKTKGLKFKLYGAFIVKFVHVRVAYYKVRHFLGRVKRKLIG